MAVQERLPGNAARAPTPRVVQGTAEINRRCRGLLADVLAPEGDVALVCWAHLSLRLVDWAIRHLAASDVAAWLGVVARLAPRGVRG
ncbi:hypothetical protein [Nonomuraea sp. NPDC050783]|uniref:hypothetical protein n=1 Tax=Nonomuraea sp. NPDC050783 TaxID=3154634 RepID=UPI0034678CAA